MFELLLEISSLKLPNSCKYMLNLNVLEWDLDM